MLRDTTFVRLCLTAETSAGTGVLPPILLRVHGRSRRSLCPVCLHNSGRSVRGSETIFHVFLRTPFQLPGLSVASDSHVLFSSLPLALYSTHGILCRYAIFHFSLLPVRFYVKDRMKIVIDNSPVKQK